jgi:hypothetical protein
MKLNLEQSKRLAGQLALPIIILSLAIPQDSAFKTPIAVVGLILAIINVERLIGGRK